MISTIIAMSGRKGAGKNTLATFIQQWFRASNAWRYPTDPFSGNPSMECSFADTLKDFCIETLGLDESQCYGSDEQKNSLTDYDWALAPKFLQWKFGDEDAKKSVAKGASQDLLMLLYHKLLLKNDQKTPVYKTGKMTGREVMQVFGTDLIRQSFGNVWAEATVRKIKKSSKWLAIITDNRFPNEIKSVLKESRGFVIRLTRSPFGITDIHPSESALDSFDWACDKCYVLDNANMDIDEQNVAVVSILEKIFGN